MVVKTEGTSLLPNASGELIFVHIRGINTTTDLKVGRICSLDVCIAAQDVHQRDMRGFRSPSRGADQG